MNTKPTATTTKNNTWYHRHHRARRAGRQAKFIRELFANDFTVADIQKIFYKLSTVQIIAIVRQ